MKKINAYFSIGTAGIMLTALVQIILTLSAADEALQFFTFILYIVFIISMYKGLRIIVKESTVV